MGSPFFLFLLPTCDFCKKQKSHLQSLPLDPLFWEVLDPLLRLPLAPLSRLGNNNQHYLNFHFLFTFTSFGSSVSSGIISITFPFLVLCMISIIFTFTFFTPLSRLGNNYQHSCCFHFLVSHHLCNGISPIENSQIICNRISPIENSPFQNWSSSTFSTSGFSRLFLIRILFFNLERSVKIKIKLCFLNTMTFLNSVFSYPRIKVMILHTLTFLHGVFLFCLKVWFDLLGGGNACPGSRGKSVIGSWNSISSDTEIQFLETQIYNYFKDKNTISRNT